MAKLVAFKKNSIVVEVGETLFLREVAERKFLRAQWNEPLSPFTVLKQKSMRKQPIIRVYQETDSGYNDC